MKKLYVTLVFGLIMLGILGAEPAGKIRFIFGDVHYRINPNAGWTIPKINSELEMNGVIRTGSNSNVEIIWKDNTITKLDASREMSIKSLYDLAHEKRGWTTQIKDKAQKMGLQQKNRAEVAGIRRDEVELKSESELYWDADPMVSVFDVIALYEQHKLSEAIPLFKTVIEQGPLHKDAEMAIVYLILISEEQKDSAQMKKYIDVLKKDFPQSTFVEMLPIE